MNNMPGQYKQENWQVDDGSFGGDNDRFPEAIQNRIAESCDKQGWLRPDETWTKEAGKPHGPGCGIGKGWLHLVVELDEILAQIDPDYQIHQIKEKFGGLRFYAYPSFKSGSHWDQDQKKHVIDDIELFIRTEAFYAQINKYENGSTSTCEVCGEFGKLNKGPWIRCRCEKHSET